jgi:predicted RNA-binding protein with PIN domain
MPDQPPHHQQSEWRTALDLTTDLYRTADQLRNGGHASLAEQLVQAAAPIPAALVEHGSANGALLRVETLLFVASRLRYLTPAQAEPLLQRVAGLMSVRKRAETPPPPAPTARPREVVLEESLPAPAPERAGAARPVPRPPTPEARGDVHRLVVDGSNFLGRAAGYDLGSAESRDRLLFRLQDYVRKHPAHHVVVYFDADHAAVRAVGGVEVRLTSGRRPADDIIMEFIRELPQPERRTCTVVTDDRDLGDRARTSGARVETVAWLLGHLTRSTTAVDQEPGSVRGGMNEWVEFFSQPPQRPGKKR